MKYPVPGNLNLAALFRYIFCKIKKQILVFYFVPQFFIIFYHYSSIFLCPGFIGKNQGYNVLYDSNIADGIYCNYYVID